MSRRHRTTTATISLALSISMLLAQQPSPAPNSQPSSGVFSVTTTLVQVDAVVTDSKGHYVTDLAAEDFAIFEDGKQQAITNFSYVRVTTPPTAAIPPQHKRSSKDSTVTAPFPPAQLRPEDVRRTLVLMVDDLGLSFESMAYVRSSLKKFVEQQLQPGDLVAICRTSAGSGALQQFTNDKRILLSLVDALRWNPNGRGGLTFFEPYGKFSRAAETLGGTDDIPSLRGPKRIGGTDLRIGSALTNSLDVTYDAERKNILELGTVGAIYDIVTGLREMPGRKSIVLFSDGIQLFTPGRGPQMHTSPGAGPQPFDTNGEVQEAIHKLVDRANRSATVIYTVHAAGLQTFQPDAGDRIGGDGGEMSATQMQHMLERATQIGQDRDLTFNAGQQGLAQLADETGGIAYQNGNDLNFGLKRVLQDQADYYLIGFKPPSDTFEVKHGTPGYHRISVKMLQPKLHVRTRTGFFGETDADAAPKQTTALEQMRAAMLSPFRASDIRLRLTALYAQAPKAGPAVRNLLYIDTRDLTFQPGVLDAATHTATGASAQVEIVAQASSLGGQQMASMARTYTVRAPSEGSEEVLREGVVYALDVPLKYPGPYQIRIAVRDVSSGKVGSASQFLEIPDLKKSKLALTSVVLQNGDRPAGAPAYAGTSPATRQFVSGSDVEYFCLLESGGKRRVSADNLDVQVRIVRDAKDVYNGPAKLVTVEAGGTAVLGKLELSPKLTPGDYFLGVIATDRSQPHKHPAAQWTDFEIRR